MLDVSIVVAVYNEEESLPPLCEQLDRVMRGLKKRYEIILVDDGSRDDSWPVMLRLAQQIPCLRLIRFRRNFGQTPAIAAGFDAAEGEVVITLDADMQNDPADIPMLLCTMREGDYDVVSGWRVNRQDGFIMRKIPSRIANWLISRVTKVYLHDYGCSLKAYRREVVKNINLYGELHRFVPALASWMGVRIKEVPVNHHARRYGQSKYGISRTTRVLLDLTTVSFLLNYAAKPMQIFGKWGLITAFIGVAMGVYLTALKLFTGASLSQRPLLWLAVLLIIVGVQFISLGLLGELVVRTYYETQNKPIYVIREVLGE